MANRFHKLKNNDSEFPLLENVDVYKYDNDFDYARYTPDQMTILMCAVPWDMGEAHIGNRTISGIGNVVYFGSANNRDAWFDAIPDGECYRFTTKYKELHRDQYIDVPIPFDVCAKYNYVVITYSLFANDESPVMYENANGVRKWFWFIRDVEFLAPNNTRLHVLDDAYQTWIYDVNVSGMILERGHAPMFATRADAYLANPLQNNSNLLTEDVNFGQASVVKHVDALALNAGTMYACIATSATPRGNWGNKASNNWRVPASDSYTNSGQPSYYVFALAVSDLNSFLANVNSSVPQFKQTVQGVFFASADLITLGESFTFADTTCYLLSASRKTFDLCELHKGLFGYASKYADIAKLYTSPYAHIEITDENGNVDIVRIEDSTGNIDVSAALSIAYPFVTIDAHLLGCGGNGAVSVTYRNINSHTFNVSGQWYDTLRSWSVPTFAVVLSPQLEYDYSTHYDRAQRVVDYTTAYDNANASASTAKANADASASTTKNNADATASTTKTNADAKASAAKNNADATANTTKTNANAIASSAKANADASSNTTKTNADSKASVSKTNADASADAAAANTATIAQANKNNADASADLIIDNTLLTTTANSSMASISNGSASDSANNTLAYNFDVYDSDNAVINATATSQIAAAEQQAAIGTASGVASGVIGAIASAATGNVVGAVSSAVNGIIGGASTIANTAVSVHLTAAEAQIATNSNQWHAEASNDKTDADLAMQVATTNSMTTTQNTLATGQAANSSATMKANATRTQTAENTAAANTQATEKANNLRSYNTETDNNARTNTTDLANNARTYNTETESNARTNATSLANNTRTYNTETESNARTNATSLANNTRTYDTDIANNLRTYNTAIENATRTRTQAQSAITNDIAQAGLRAPFIFGEFSNGESSANKPIALFANIVTQSKAAIESAGDEFLRYGYAFDKQWQFDGNWNVGKYFTYWKLRDFWVSDLNVPDMYMDKLRFFLFGGVTVWRDPADIGKRTIYENFNS